jgi:hypothetical protein
MLKERDSRTPKPEEAAASEEPILKKTKGNEASDRRD